MQRTPLGVAVVGAGYWGPNLVRNFHASQEWSVRCVVERDRERLERILRFYPSIAGLTPNSMRRSPIKASMP